MRIITQFKIITTISTKTHKLTEILVFILYEAVPFNEEDYWLFIAKGIVNSI